MSPDRNELEQRYDVLAGGLKPPVSSFPNIVLPIHHTNVRLIAEITGSKVAWWGRAPDFAADGQPNTQLWDTPKYFALWAQSVNQVPLQARGGFAHLGCFTMYLPTDTPIDILNAIDKSLTVDIMPAIDDVWPTVAKHLDRIGWVYFPLSDDDNLALFVHTPAKDFARLLRSDLVAANRLVGTVRATAGTDRCVFE